MIPQHKVIIFNPAFIGEYLQECDRNDGCEKLSVAKANLTILLRAALTKQNFDVSNGKTIWSELYDVLEFAIFCILHKLGFV